MSDSEIRAEETSKGGMKYELVLSEPAGDAPNINANSMPKSVSVEEIEQKLKAAEERRLTLEAQKQNQYSEKWNKLQEANQKRQEYNNNFIQSTKESLEQKMEIMQENREAYIKAIQEKIKEHERHVEEVRQTKVQNGNENENDVNEEVAVAPSC